MGNEGYENWQGVTRPYEGTSQVIFDHTPPPTCIIAGTKVQFF